MKHLKDKIIQDDPEIIPFPVTGYSKIMFFKSLRQLTGMPPWSSW